MQINHLLFSSRAYFLQYLDHDPPYLDSPHLDSPHSIHLILIHLWTGRVKFTMSFFQSIFLNLFSTKLTGIVFVFFHSRMVIGMLSLTRTLHYLTSFFCVSRGGAIGSPSSLISLILYLSCSSNLLARPLLFTEDWLDLGG
jgi:hypothetical protein